MKNNTKTLNISTKKAWIIATILSLLASILPTWFIAELAEEIFKEIESLNFFYLYRFYFPVVFIIFFLFFALFILICKWQGNKK